MVGFLSRPHGKYVPYVQPASVRKRCADTHTRCARTEQITRRVGEHACTHTRSIPKYMCVNEFDNRALCGSRVRARFTFVGGCVIGRGVE